MPPDLLPTLITRTEELATALEGIGETDLLGPSALPDWSRLTIAAHLRYGAVALHRMTLDVLDGRPTAYYPLGREAQRPGTLSPTADETPRLVLRSLREESDRLHERWSGLSGAEWSMVADEPQLARPANGVHALVRLRPVSRPGEASRRHRRGQWLRECERRVLLRDRRGRSLPADARKLHGGARPARQEGHVRDRRLH